MAKQQGYIKGEFVNVPWWRKERNRRRIVRTVAVVGTGVVLYSQQKRLMSLEKELDRVFEWAENVENNLTGITQTFDDVFIELDVLRRKGK